MAAAERNLHSGFYSLSPEAKMTFAASLRPVVRLFSQTGEKRHKGDTIY